MFEAELSKAISFQKLSMIKQKIIRENNLSDEELKILNNDCRKRYNEISHEKRNTIPIIYVKNIKKPYNNNNITKFANIPTGHIKLVKEKMYNI